MLKRTLVFRVLFNKHMGTIKETKGVEWHKGDTPHLWNYSDSDYYSNNLWRNTIERILLANSEVDIIFKNSTKMQEILAKRVV